MWLATQNAPNYWVEEGYKAGGGDGSHYGYQFFWSDSRGSSYNDHFIRAATTGDVGVYTNVTLNWVHGTRNWNVVLEGKQVGVSTLNGDSVGHGVEAGAEEAVSNTAAIWAHMKNWQYDNGSGWLPVGGLTPIHTANSNMSLSALGSSGGRPQFSVSTPSAPCGKTPAIVQHGAFSNLDEATAARVALTDARLNGSRAAVSSIKVVSTTRAQAVAFDNGDKIIRGNPNAPVFLIELRGNISKRINTPSGADSSRAGSVYRVVVNQSDGFITDTSLITSSTANVAALGIVTNVATG